MKDNLTVSKESFLTMSPDAKLVVIYDILAEQHRCMCDLENKISVRSAINTTISGVTGLVGGAIAMVAGKFIKI
jgi:hypothetical protein